MSSGVSEKERCRRIVVSYATQHARALGGILR